MCIVVTQGHYHKCARYCGLHHPGGVQPTHSLAAGECEGSGERVYLSALSQRPGHVCREHALSHGGGSQAAGMHYQRHRGAGRECCAGGVGRTPYTSCDSR